MISGAAWVAINPATAGIAAATVDGVDVGTINVLAARTRGAMPPRLGEIIHDAIPQPVVLIYADDTTNAPGSLSFDQKRAAKRVVVTALHDTGALTEDDRGLPRWRWTDRRLPTWARSVRN